MDFDTVCQFGELAEVILVEAENVNMEALQLLKSQGKAIYPDPDVLTILNDRCVQKMFYQDHDLPCIPCKVFESRKELELAMRNRELRPPLVQRMRNPDAWVTGANVILRKRDLRKLPNGSLAVEHWVDVDKEISVVVSRNVHGKSLCFPPAELSRGNNGEVQKLTCPAALEVDLESKVCELAQKVVNSLSHVGILEVRFLLDRDQRLWVNEAHPRPFGLGYHTIESTVTSQYEQHLRAVLGLPLGSTRLKLPSVMISTRNLPPEYLEQSLSIEGVKVHLDATPSVLGLEQRGVLIVVGQTLHEVARKAERIEQTLLECAG